MWGKAFDGREAALVSIANTGGGEANHGQGWLTGSSCPVWTKSQILSEEISPSVKVEFH